MINRKHLIQRDQVLLNFKNYEEYLESFITERDLFHLRSKVLARNIVELGYHTEGTLDRETFYKRVKTIKRILYLMGDPLSACSENLELHDTLLKQLALREKANREENLYTIIFLRVCGKSLSQISGYIDYSFRLKAEDWLPYFLNEKKIKPLKCDLSYYNWKTETSIVNSSPNFKSIIDGNSGISFRNIKSGKIVTVDPNVTNSSDLARIVIFSEIYGRIVLYDHIPPKSEEEG